MVPARHLFSVKSELVRSPRCLVSQCVSDLCVRYSGVAFPAIYAALAEGDFDTAQFVLDRIAVTIRSAAVYLSNLSGL